MLLFIHQPSTSQILTTPFKTPIKNTQKKDPNFELPLPPLRGVKQIKLQEWEFQESVNKLDDEHYDLLRILVL